MDFKNSLVIMTSNIGSRHYADGTRSVDDVQQEVLDDLRRHFRPEFLNRVDDVILFHGLEREHLEQIVEIQIKRVSQRLADQKLQLDLDGDAKRMLAREGYDPVFGARPLKRVIQRKILDALALEMLAGRFQAGDRIHAAVSPADDTQLVFEKVD